MHKEKIKDKDHKVLIQGQYLSLKRKQAESVVLPDRDYAYGAHANENKSIKNGLYFFFSFFF